MIYEYNLYMVKLNLAIYNELLIFYPKLKEITAYEITYFFNEILTYFSKYSNQNQ